MVSAESSPATTTRSEVRALLILDAMPRIGLVRLKRLVDAFGSAERALHGPAHHFDAVAGPRAAEGRGDASVEGLVDAALADADRKGMDVCAWTDADYPRALLNLHDPPPVLFLRGRRELLVQPAVTIVGARHATPRARDVAERLGAAVARTGLTVASGLALGVDGAAHRGALAVEGDTLAVLGRGADAPYPPSHRDLFRDIVGRGLVVSEFLPGTPPLAFNFPRRNRILAALSQAVVVVEAGATSGALITVDHALDLGIEIWAVPGPIEIAACEGSNRLLADGARPLVSIAAFVRALTGADPESAAESETFSGPAGRVLSGLGTETLGVDQLALKLELSVTETLALLTEMELGGLVRQMPGMRFRRAA